MTTNRRAYLVGGGIGSLAAAAFMIRDGGMTGESITIFEAMPKFGGSLDGAGNADTIATVAKVAVWAFAIVIAVNQLGIAQTLVNTLFMAVTGALALALGLAFGLGGRDAAQDLIATMREEAVAAKRYWLSPARDLLKIKHSGAYCARTHLPRPGHSYGRIG